jgi:hypothetical protein
MRSLVGKIPSRYGFSHGLVALLVTAPAGLIGWHWWAAVGVSAFYVGREHTHAGDTFDPRKWSADNIWDFLVPLAVSIGVASVWALEP